MYVETATAYILDWFPLAGIQSNAGGSEPQQLSWWTHDFPFAVIPPGWSLVFTNPATKPDTLYLSMVWEAIYADELDFMW